MQRRFQPVARRQIQGSNVNYSVFEQHYSRPDGSNATYDTFKLDRYFKRKGAQYGEFTQNFTLNDIQHMRTALDEVETIIRSRINARSGGRKADMSWQETVTSDFDPTMGSRNR